MSNIAICASNLGKQYKIGRGKQARYKTIRESINEAVTAPLRRLLEPSSRTEPIWALKDISFEVKQGQVVGIVGRNGAGKSTLLKILSRVTKPTIGRVEVYGRLGSLLEVGTGFHPELTGRENIYLNGAILGMKKVEIGSKFDEIVAFAEIEKFLDTPVKHYSSGMYVRLAFAVAAHLEPEILLIDEVLAVGDLAFQKKCLGKIHDVAESGRTILFVSHNLPVVKKLCDYGYLLNEGQLINQGSIDAVLDAYYDLTNDTDHNTDVVDINLLPEGTVRYVSWRLNNSKTQQDHQCYSEELCVFDFQLAVRRRVNTGNFALLIFDGNGNWILGIRRGVHSNECVILSGGIYRIRFIVPTLPLKPGRYVLMATAGDLYEGNFEEWYAQPKLEVLPLEKEGFTSAEMWGGILNIHGQIEVDLLEP